MRVPLTLFACALLLGSTGCIIPLPNKVSKGHRYSKDALAFLDLPGTTREEVIASLGPPLVEHESRIVLYEWQETPRFYACLPYFENMEKDTDFKDKIVQGDAEQFGLFIAYDAKGVVEAHEIQEICGITLHQACADWQKQREKKR